MSHSGSRRSGLCCRWVYVAIGNNKIICHSVLCCWGLCHSVLCCSGLCHSAVWYVVQVCQFTNSGCWKFCQHVSSWFDLWKSTLQLSLGQFWLMKHIFKIELVFTNSLDPNHHWIPIEQLLDQRLDPYPYITQTDQKHILKENRYKIFTLGGKTRQSFATFFFLFRTVAYTDVLC